MQQFFRSAHSLLAWLFLVLLPVQFFLAGIGAFRVVNQHTYDDNWGAHDLVGSLLGLIAILILIAALVGRPQGRMLRFSIILFVLMIVQVVLAGFGDSSATVIAALHPVNALFIVFVASMLANQARVNFPFEGFRTADTSAATPVGGTG